MTDIQRRADTTAAALSALLQSHNGRVMNIDEGGTFICCVCIPKDDATHLMADIISMVESAYQLGMADAAK